MSKKKSSMSLAGKVPTTRLSSLEKRRLEKKDGRNINDETNSSQNESKLKGEYLRVRKTPITQAT
jgi:hypothetical protein|tara:strand:- start:156 stop:350 length:195 start_codon:yes stop_codon:yes gene_type:complete